MIISMNETHVIDAIPFEFEFTKFAARIHIDDFSGYMDMAKTLAEKALPLIKPKAVYTVAYIQNRDEVSVNLGDVIFKSKALAYNLRDIHRIFPYVATCGNELEDADLTEGDQLFEYWLEEMKYMALSTAIEHLSGSIREKFGIKDVSTMNPGSGDAHVWPINEQKKLFSIFGNVEELIGVELLKSNLMLPNKSVSGVFFVSDSEFVNCQLCTRDNCPNRRSPYTGLPAD
jgi:hypothetical protein